VDVQLSNEESEALQKAQRSYLSDLRAEIADTDNPGYKRDLRHEREVLEAVVANLDQASSSSQERGPEGQVVIRVVTAWTT
jgi:hypothetical protein